MHPLQHPGFTGVVQQQRMQVAVTGMEDVHHQQVVTPRDVVHGVENLGEPRPWHHRVVQVVVRCHLGHRPERRLASLPQRCTFSIVSREAHLGCTAVAGDIGDACRIDLHPGLEPVDLGQQHRSRVNREARVHVILHRNGDALVHDLHGGGHDAGSDHRAHRGGRRGGRVERDQQGAHRWAIRGDRHRDPGGDTQHALAADEYATQVVARRFGVEPAKQCQSAVG